VEDILVEASSYSEADEELYLEKVYGRASQKLEDELSRNPRGSYVEKMCHGVRMMASNADDVEAFASRFQQYVEDFVDEKEEDAAEALSRIVPVLEP